MNKLLLCFSAVAILFLSTSMAFATPQKVVVVILENTSYSEAINEPFLGKLAKAGTLLTNFRGVTHPSQPNYIAMVGGSTLGVSGNGSANLSAKNLADLLEAKGLSWHVYAENFPGRCFSGSTSSGGYARKHNPFMSFTDITKNPARCANITNEATFLNDFRTGRLANYTMYVPNLNNDGHDTGAAFADSWMAKTFSSILSDPVAMKDTLFVATFDEDDGGNGNQVYTVLYGPDVKSGLQISASYTHYNLLATIESLFQLGTLGMNDLNSMPIAGFLK
jgi:hypothetical protein